MNFVYSVIMRKEGVGGRESCLTWNVMSSLVAILGTLYILLFNIHYHHIIYSYSEEKTSGTEQEKSSHPVHETKEVMI